MIYNIHYLVAAFVFLLFVFYHFMGQRQMDIDDNVQFFWFALLGICDIGFDILCTILMSMNRPELALITQISLTILYILQVLVPYRLVLYALHLRGKSYPSIWNRWGIVPAIMISLIFLNIWDGIFFYFEADGTYVRGPYYYGMYAYAGLAVLAIAIDSIYHRKKLGKQNFKIVWEFLLIAAACVAIQAFHLDLLMTGFGIALGITVMFLTINNPYGYSDSLTSLLNAQYFKTYMQKNMARGKAVHLLVVDIYRLRQINKVLGTSYGDEVLVSMAKKVQAVSNQNLTFRIYGNQFVVATSSLTEYAQARKNIKKALEEGLNVQGDKTFVSAIICGILNAEQLEDYDYLLGYIDYLITLVPRAEKISVIQCSEESISGYARVREIEKYLSTAVAEDLFEVYYQPIYSIEEQDYVMIEALSRLRHPTLGMIPPAMFIEIAEKSGQIWDIGQLQFKRVCKFVKEHPEIMNRYKNVKINMSPAELMKEEYPTMVIETIRSFGLPYEFFQFEITETVATEYTEQLYRMVDVFHKVGIKLCLDDFGSGYANLNTVLRIDFSSIKVDRSLLKGIEKGNKIAMFYRNIVRLLRSMGYEVVAEGIETKQERDLVVSWGVDMIQGFYFAKPMPGEELL